MINRNFRNYWRLDKEIVFLNHGSFGATPIPVMDKQREIQGLIEREPVKFFIRDYEGFYERAQEALAGVVGAERDDIVFVPNATTGVNTALRAIPLSPGDEILVTNQEYNACRNAVNAIAHSATPTAQQKTDRARKATDALTVRLNAAELPRAAAPAPVKP